jgi:hypothetical protein
MKNICRYVTVFTISLLCQAAFADLPTAPEQRNRPNIEFGGNVSFANTSNSNSSQYLFDFSPFVSKYFSSFFIGPIAGISISKGNYNSLTKVFIYGLHCGRVFGNTGNTYLPYADIGIAGSTVQHYGTSNGLVIPFEFGLKTMIGSSAFVNGGLLYTFQKTDGYRTNTFGAAIGISIYK